MSWLARARALLSVSPLLSAGCSLVFPAPVPMHTIVRVADEHHPSRCLVVFLPGFGDSARAFIDHGFVDALRARSLPVDSISAGATFGYYSRRTVVPRLREDVFLPARAKGYEQIWVVGISMGGVGALLVAKEPDLGVSGVYLMAPYLGDSPLLQEITRAGGLGKWEPGTISKDDYQRDNWRFLKSAVEHPDAAPVVYLGAGNEDKLREGHRVLAPALPKERVFVVPGIHDWGPWSILWADFLDHSDFRARCATP